MNILNYMRVLSHGKISDLSNGFALKNNTPFSIYVRPKNDDGALDTIVSCKCMNDSEFSDLPVPLYAWTEAAIVELGANAISLSDYDVYYGGGNQE